MICCMKLPIICILSETSLFDKNWQYVGNHSNCVANNVVDQSHYTTSTIIARRPKQNAQNCSIFETIFHIFLLEISVVSKVFLFLLSISYPSKSTEHNHHALPANRVLETLCYALSAVVMVTLRTR